MEQKLACSHLASGDWGELDYQKLYTGVGTNYALVCENCDGSELVEIDCALALDIEEQRYPCGVLGEAEILMRDLPFSFEQRALPYLELLTATHNDSCWLGLGADGSLQALECGTKYPQICPTHFELDETVLFSALGDLIFLAPSHGQHGEVFCLNSGRSLLTVDRGDYQIGHCVFPHAFFVAEGQTLLIHASDWNRLDITNPRSGKVLTERENGDLLDYFHCGLSVSPKGTRIADDGWVWHPVGIVRTWNLRDWSTQNIFESENGPSIRNLCQREYLWDSALCWIDEKRLAVWGQGTDDVAMIPAALIFDAESGNQESWFPGPDISGGGWFCFHNYLFSVSPQVGTSAWDVETGARLHQDTDFTPRAHFQGEFLSWGEQVTLARFVAD